MEIFVHTEEYNMNGPTKHHTRPHQTAPDPKILGGRNWPDSPAYTWPRYTIPEGVRMLIFNSYPGMNWK